MRKVPAILIALSMTLILGLTPGLAVIPADAFSGLYGISGKVNESRLPACCRRHGAHHCAMGVSADVADTTSSVGSTDAGLAIVAAPSFCPFAPKALAPAVLTFTALLLLVIIAAGNRPEAFRISGSDQPRDAVQLRGWPKRGPPMAQLL